MNFGAALGGFSDGLGNGLNMAAQLAALQNNRRMSDARRAVGAAYAMGGGAPAMPQPPMPGEMSMPANGNAGPPLPISQDAPQMPPRLTMGQPDFSQAMPPMISAGDDLGQGGGMPPEPIAPGPAMGAGGDPLSGTAAPSGDAVHDAQGTIMSIAQQIKAANPGIAPEALFDATGLQIEQMKGVRNDVKDYMMSQIELAKIQARVQGYEMRLSGQQYVADRNYEGRTDAATIRGDASRDVATTQGNARTDAARIAGGSRTDAARIGADARVAATERSSQSREYSADQNRGASDYRADQGYRGRVDSASAMAGSTARTKPGPRYQQPARPGAAQPARGGRSGAKPYSKAEDVRAAFQSGQITRDQAVFILKRDFGMQ